MAHGGTIRLRREGALHTIAKQQVQKKVRLDQSSIRPDEHSALTEADLITIGDGRDIPNRSLSRQHKIARSRLRTPSPFLVGLPRHTLNIVKQETTARYVGRSYERISVILDRRSLVFAVHDLGYVG